MKRYLHARVKSHLDEEIPIKPDKPIDCLIQAALACDGIQEEGGDNRGKMVEAFQATVGGVNGESWCLSFIQALVAYVEDRYNASANIPVTEMCMNLWDHAPKKFKLIEEEPIPGDIIIWRYGQSMKGHCGIVIDNRGKPYLTVTTIEANTSMGATVEREGNGVAQKTQSKKGLPQKHVIGFVRIEFTPIK
jgi:hypothetical protein